MKKSLLALAALTAFAGLASAQSSVTVFGVVDLGARNVKNGSAGDISGLSTDGNASSRLGFRGVEDLGGGLRAGFWLEGALSADNGGGTAGSPPGATGQGQTWQRRSTVSLMGGFGEVRLGRDYTPTFWNHTVFDPFGTNGVGSGLNVVAQPFPNRSFVRTDNSVGYFLPAMGGLYGQAMVAAGEGRPGNKYFGGRLGYAAGPLNIAGSYGTHEQDGPMADDITEWNIGGSFNFGFMTLMGKVVKLEYGAAEIDNWQIGLLFPVGAGTIKAAYAIADHKRADGTKPTAEQFAIGYVYDLSKRTALYAHYSTVDNDNGLDRTASNSGPSPTVAGITGFKSTGYEFGIRHSF